MKYKIKFSIVLIIPFLLSFSNLRLPGLLGIRLNTIEGENFAMSQLSLNKASVLVFLLPDCPACESYSKTLGDLHQKFNSQGVKFYGIFPGKYNTQEEMIEFKKNYKIQFSLLKDPENLTVKALDAHIVPSAFLLNNKGEVLYKGRIDDWLYSLGKKRAIITEHNLNDALESFLAGKTINIKETKAIGCILED